MNAAGRFWRAPVITRSAWITSRSTATRCHKPCVTSTLHRNFMGYTSRHVAPLIGLGVSAIGDAWTAFVQNEKTIEPYQERVRRGELPILRGHLLDAEDLVLRRLILELMTRFHTRWDGCSRSSRASALDSRAAARTRAR